LKKKRGKGGAGSPGAVLLFRERGKKKRGGKRETELRFSRSGLKEEKRDKPGLAPTGRGGEKKKERRYPLRYLAKKKEKGKEDDLSASEQRRPDSLPYFLFGRGGGGGKTSIPAGRCRGKEGRVSGAPDLALMTLNHKGEKKKEGEEEGKKEGFRFLHSTAEGKKRRGERRHTVRLSLFLLSLKEMKGKKGGRG